MKKNDVSQKRCKPKIKSHEKKFSVPKKYKPKETQRKKICFFIVLCYCSIFINKSLMKKICSTKKNVSQKRHKQKKICIKVLQKKRFLSTKKSQYKKEYKPKDM